MVIADVAAELLMAYNMLSLSMLGQSLKLTLATRFQTLTRCRLSQPEKVLVIMADVCNLPCISLSLVQP